MDSIQSNFAMQSWPSAVWAVAAIVVAVLVYRYLSATATLRFQASAERAVREQEREVLRREDRLKNEEKHAVLEVARRQQEREDNAREAEAERARLAILHEEAKADVAGNSACAEDSIRILAEADLLLVKICRYYVVRDEEIDPDSDDQEDPLINLGDMKGKIQESYDAALDYFDEAQKMVTEGLYVVAKRQAEACLLEARYTADRIANLDTKDWNKIQAAAR